MTGTASSSPGMPCASDKGTLTLSSPSLCITTECNANSPYPFPRDGACPLPRCRNLQMPALSRGETQWLSPGAEEEPPQAAPALCSPRYHPPPHNGTRLHVDPLAASGQQSHPARHHAIGDRCTPGPSCPATTSPERKWITPALRRQMLSHSKKVICLLCHQEAAEGLWAARQQGFYSKSSGCASHFPLARAFPIPTGLSSPPLPSKGHLPAPACCWKAPILYFLA